MSISELGKYIDGKKHGHLIGIGGVSMAPLAEVLSGLGVFVTGSDMNRSESVEHLMSLGIDIKIGHAPENIDGADFIVRTAAAREDNVEIAEARKRGIPVFERAEAWGHIMRSYKNAVCVSGTHGKTTTTSMITHIFMNSSIDPTVMIGGTLPLLKAGHRIGGGDTIVMESCEYYNSFLSFSPTVALILNIEADHLDFFKDIEDIKKSFRKFASLVPEKTGTVIANGDDKNTTDALAGLDRKIITFGLEKTNDVYADNIEFIGSTSEFDVVYNGEKFVHLKLNIPGIHNVKNAVAATTAAIILGVEPENIAGALEKFSGAGRRFEYKGEVNGAMVYDDYAHHPGELKALLDMALNLSYDRVILCFQPHTYSRTKALFDDFVEQLARADKAYLCEIYAAREQNTIGISSRDLCDKIPGSEYFATFEELEEKLRREAKKGELILTVGAGNIYRVGEEIVK